MGLKKIDLKLNHKINTEKHPSKFSVNFFAKCTIKTVSPSNFCMMIIFIVCMCRNEQVILATVWCRLCDIYVPICVTSAVKSLEIKLNCSQNGVATLLLNVNTFLVIPQVLCRRVWYTAPLYIQITFMRKLNKTTL